MQSVRELEETLSTYREQLQQVNDLLSVDPENGEYKEMCNGLKEVIELTEDLLATARAAESSNQAPSPPEPPPFSSTSQPQSFIQSNGSDSIAARFGVGTKVQAVWSEDGEWYDATIESLTPNGYTVVYDGWGNREEVDVGNVRGKEVVAVEETKAYGEPINEKGKEIDKEEKEGEEEDMIAAAQEIAEKSRLELRRKIAEAGAHGEILPRDLPPKLRIHPDDPEEVKAAKRKKIHAFKSKQRLEILEITQNKRQNAWQQFQSTGKKKKTGFFTGRKKESIFKSPDDPMGKVGVTGSGHGMTEFQKREKYLNLKTPGSESES